MNDRLRVEPVKKLCNDDILQRRQMVRLISLARNLYFMV